MQAKPFILIEASVKDQAVRFRSANRFLKAKEILKDDVIVDERGAYCVVSKYALDAVASMKHTDSEGVEVEISGSGSLIIRSSDRDAEYEIGVFGPDNLTRFDNKPSDNIAEIRCEEFRDMVNKTLFSRSRNFPSEITFKDNYMTCAGISSVRIALDRIRVNTDIEAKIKLHGESLELIGKLASSKTGKMLFGWSDESVSVKCDDFVLIAPIVNTPTPDYESLIQSLEGNDKVITLSMLEFRRKLSPFLLFVGEDASTIRMDISKNLIKAELDNAKVGRTKWDISCEYSGDPISIVLNVTYLHEFARRLNSGDLIMKIKDNKTPVLFRGEGAELCYMMSPVWNP